MEKQQPLNDFKVGSKILIRSDGPRIIWTYKMKKLINTIQTVVLIQKDRNLPDNLIYIERPDIPRSYWCYSIEDVILLDDLPQETIDLLIELQHHE